MKRTLLLALIPLLAAGCMGGGAAPAPSTQPVQEATTPATTSLRLTYPVGRVVSKRVNVPGCPVRAECRLWHLPRHCQTGRFYCPPRPWLRVAHRVLTCSPNGGSYPNPDAACSALADVMRLKATGPVVACSCPAQAYRTVRARARGRYLGKQVAIPLDFCSLCGLGPGAAHDARVLMPQT